MVDTKDLSCVVAFLIGVRDDMLERYYKEECSELLDNLVKNINALRIRHLSILRTCIMRNYSNVDYEMRNLLKNLDSLAEYIPNESVSALKDIGIDITITNPTAIEYIISLSKLIKENIDYIKDLFDDWIKWDYIKALFIIPNHTDKGAIKSEVNTYKRLIPYYPFQMYIHWKPQDYGYILGNDRKFLKVLYGINKDTFEDYMKYKDADEETKNNIYNFINDAGLVQIFVDCENSDVFKLINVLYSLNDDELSKIEKIVLYQDSEHTSSGWNFIEQTTDIPIEHNVITRVKDNKSLVDTMMVAGVSKACYRDRVDSFIILASDSDYCSLYDSIDEARFLVMLEKDKCSYALINALNDMGIYYCLLDNFNSAKSTAIKKAVLLEEFNKILPDIYGMLPLDIAKLVYRNAKITATIKEMEVFCNLYIKTLKLKFDSEKGLYYEIQS